MNSNHKPEAGAGDTATPEYMDKRQLAARLGVSERTICNLMARGLPYIALTGKLRRFPRRAVDEWLASHQIRRA
jgi:excisionase family DNA binding protein